MVWHTLPISGNGVILYCKKKGLNIILPGGFDETAIWIFCRIHFIKFYAHISWIFHFYWSTYSIHSPAIYCLPHPNHPLVFYMPHAKCHIAYECGTKKHRVVKHLPHTCTPNCVKSFTAITFAKHNTDNETNKPINNQRLRLKKTNKRRSMQ